MSDLEILILEANELTALTVNSIKKNMPRAKYKVVKCGKSKVGTAISNCTKPTLVVTSGLVLNIRQGDIPPVDKINNYDICVSRMGVYVDHPKHSTTYGLIDSPLNKGFIDLSIFILNPKNWFEIPETDAGFLSTKKCLYMPRYINHKHDPLVKDCIGSYEAFRYGLSGESAAVLNYLPHLISGKATPIETFAYCFDKVAEYAEGLPEDYKQKVLKLGNKTKVRVGKLRKALYELNLGE
jgi:hypothetical protein